MTDADIMAKFAMMQAQIDDQAADLSRLRTAVTNELMHRPADPAPDFSGKVVVMGKLVAVSGSPAARVRVNFANLTAVYTNDAAPDPMPINEEWYEVAETIGTPHCGPR